MSNDGSRSQGADRARMLLSRRRFLRAMAVAAGAVALSGLTGAGVARAAEDFPHYPDRFGVLTDTTRCIGCRMCEQACASANGMPAPSTDPQIFAGIRRQSTKALTVVNRYSVAGSDRPVYRKQQCMHCDEPACVSACPVKALRKTAKGPVVWDENLCMGCRYCMIACPFSVLSYEYDDPLTPKVVKCQMCYRRAVKDDKPTACASVCPTQALQFGHREDLLYEARERILNAPDTYLDHVYGEHEAGGTGWLYLASVPFAQLGLPEDIGRTPYPELTRDFLLAVPVAYVMMPPALAGIQALIKRQEQVAAGEEKKEAGQ